MELATDLVRRDAGALVETALLRASPKPVSFEFDAVSHTYRLDGEVVPGVTSVLKSVGIIDYSFIPQEILQRASKRGTAVHLALQYLDEGCLDRTSVDVEHRGYIEAYERFVTESGFEPAHIEHRVYHPVYRYAGTLDRTGLLNGTLTILDFKTGLVLPGHALQLAAYANCLAAPRRFRRIALQLNADATYRVYEYPMRSFNPDANLFLSALACHQFKSLGSTA